MRRVFEDQSATKLWTRLLVTYSGLMLRITAANVQEEADTTPGFEVFEPGDVIIRQGERADFVFNMSAGVAEVIVDDVTVGRIGEGEIFGAMAAFTGEQRNATVVAREDCQLLAIPKAQFVDLIKAQPEIAISLLDNMSRRIKSLNEQVSSAQRQTA